MDQCCGFRRPPAGCKCILQKKHLAPSAFQNSKILDVLASACIQIQPFTVFSDWCPGLVSGGNVTLSVVAANSFSKQQHFFFLLPDVQIKTCLQSMHYNLFTLHRLALCGATANTNYSTDLDTAI